MLNSAEYVSKELRWLKAKIKDYQHGGVGLPEGRLSSYEKKGKKYYIKIVEKNGEFKRTYLGNGRKVEVQQLQKKYFLNHSIVAMERNIKLMELFMKKYSVIDPNYLQENFPSAYQSLPENCFDVAGAFDIRQWASAHYTKNTKHTENLRHTTKQGFLVRSKSEVIIANSIAARGLECRYDEVIRVGDRYLSPDFTLIDPKENKIVYWEHFGMINESKYLQHCLWKLQQYINNEIVPGVNLIITFDDVKGNIDSLMIERTLDSWFGNI